MQSASHHILRASRRLAHLRTSAQHRCFAALLGSTDRPATKTSVTQFSSSTTVKQAPVPKLDTACAGDFVKEAIKKMIIDRDDEEHKSLIGAKTIDKRLDSFARWYSEARSCISDCQEAQQSQDYLEEVKVAEAAVEKTYASFLDLIEDLQHVSADLANQYNDARLENVAKLRQLREELDALQGTADRSLPPQL
mmetsp:Transcript_13052/g.36014  ORF Transcript_13052/g.36014 Transcript_13052/m.36014 type:complete len:194 (-) Transcript_13052:822-1403(-)|eukprot:CAMPEP_0198134258 /NCGR_PEP_ID=MMETSP1442-20131203/59986_1 /TAXON_ID= /ORGANISM="Craspedostauros australis, Strain CCMP3328" /LENGTH=193 /DNA_ID=CAMNT_0043795399 /DNA_START=651 /DNA_END=1232 /DNA_ORIENTATION=-